MTQLINASGIGRLVGPVKCIALFAVLALSTAASPAAGRDWFVRPDSEGGDGSREKPFKDPYLAIEKAEAGDVIHVAEGIYHGKLESAYWVVRVPNLSMLGGYDKDFKERDPWKHPSELRFVKGSKVRVEGQMVRGEGDHSNFVLDGFLIDGREGNVYADPSDPLSDLKRDFSPKKELVILSSPGCQVRNCLVLNSSDWGMVMTCDGCVIENSVFMNNVNHNVELRAPAPALQAAAKATTVKGNSFLFPWATCEYGKGGPDGNGLKVGSEVKVEIADNVFQNCDNHAIFNNSRPDRVSIKNNVFWMNGYSNVKIGVEGRDVAIDNSNMGDLDDVGFKACESNEVKDPGFGGFDVKWMEKFINRSAAERGKVTMDDWNKARQILGLPLIAEGGKGPTGVAMAYDARKALALVPKVSQGSHPKKLEVKFSGGGGAEAALAYETTPFENYMKDGGTLDGKRVAIPCHLGGERSWFPYACATEKVYRGWYMMGFGESAGRDPLIYVKRGSNAEKLCDALTFGEHNRSIEKYVVKGTVKADEATTGPYKWTLLVESIEIYNPALVEEKRPVGRDWFVRAGSSGNGTLAKPFKDPWQALENCEPGDVIHVAEGEYWGKLNLGSWALDTPYITLRGGYDKDFKERDPWTHVTRLGWKKGSKSTPDGTFLRGEWDHRGCIVDGFAFDGSDVNLYGGDGDLLWDRSARHAFIEVSSPNFTVRNCVMINGSLGSFTSTGDGGTIENNIFINFHWQSIQLTPARNERPWIIRNNTILVTCYDRADGQGGTSVGSGIYARGDVAFECDNNIIGFNDCQGVFADQKSPLRRVKLTNNVFTKDLFAHYTNGRDIVFDDATMKSMPDAGFAACGGNATNVEPKFPFDKTWVEVYLSRTMTVHGKVPDDDWNKLRDVLGLPMRAEGGQAAKGYCRVYPLKKAMEMFPGNADVKAGARRAKLEVKYDPNPPAAAAEKNYRTVEWAVFQNQIDTIDKKDIEYVGMIGNILGESDSYFTLPDVKSSGYRVLDLMGPEGKEGGLPCRGYFKRGSRLEKLIKKVDASVKYKIRGAARKGEGFTRGCLVIESIEKQD